MAHSLTLRFAFGEKVRDKVTGFEGVVTGFVTYISGCDQYLVNPPAKDGGYVKGEYIDDIRLEAVDAPRLVLKRTKTKGAAPEGPPLSSGGN